MHRRSLNTNCYTNSSTSLIMCTNLASMNQFIRPKPWPFCFLVLPLQDDFAHLRPLCYPQLDAALICFSVVDPTSYENVKSKWVKEIRRHCPGVPLILIGTQVDKREDAAYVKQLKLKGVRTVSRSEGSKLASLIKATSYVECSALRQLNVKNAFDEAIAASLELTSNSKKRSPRGTCTIL